MKKNIKIAPVGLKGNEINERMKELMGIKPINENKTNVVVELTKKGPDGNSYAVIRENHEWYIKKTSKTSNILAEDFKYIGGLMNKKSEAYPSYAKAIKHLNLKFKNLAEAYNFTGEINLFENDNLISEAGIAGFSQMEGLGFSNEGNLEGNEPMIDESDMEDEEMTEAEEAIDKMLDEGEEETDDLEDTKSNDAAYEKAFDSMDESSSKNDKKSLSIKEAIKNMDSIIDSITEGLKKKV